jgi:hypothetical protein
MYNGGVEFEWDPKKATANRRGHGVAFLDATTVFDDGFAITLKDEHPDEERFVIVGMDAFGRILVVVYTWRESNIRIISARKATARERREYGES